MQIPQTGTKNSAGGESDVEKGNARHRLAGHVARLVTTDPAEFELALRPWELLCSPMVAGAFGHHLVMLRTPLFLMYKEKFDLPLHIQGLSPPNMLGIGIPMHIGREARFWGISHEAGSLPATLPGALDAKVKAGHFQLIVFVDLEALEDLLSGPLVEALVHAAEFHLMQVPPPHLAAFATWGDRTLDRFIASPEMAESPAALEAVYRELIDHLAALAGALAPTADMLASPARHRGFQRALEFLRYDHSCNISMPELCGIAGISERSLQYAFRDAYDLTPVEFMTRRRLHAARQKLLTSQSAETNVTEIAMDFGFSELGRFAARYRRAFGEVPSKTLARAEP